MANNGESQGNTRLWYTEIPGYAVFFDQGGKLLSYLPDKDESFRKEFQADLFRCLGIDVRYFPLPKSVYETIDRLINDGKCESDGELIEKHITPCLEKRLKAKDKDYK